MYSESYLYMFKEILHYLYIIFPIYGKVKRKKGNIGFFLIFKFHFMLGFEVNEIM